MNQALSSLHGGSHEVPVNHTFRSQYYDICFRRERGYCSICFTPYITSTTAATYTSFGVSASADAAASQSAVSTLCGSKYLARNTNFNQYFPNYFHTLLRVHPILMRIQRSWIHTGKNGSGSGSRSNKNFFKIY